MANAHTQVPVEIPNVRRAAEHHKSETDPRVGQTQSKREAPLRPDNQSLTMSSLFAPAPEPPTKLGYLRTLSSRAGVHVSPLCLGAMSIGDKWSEYMGSMDKEASFKLLDAYFDMGGNFIDTANN